MVLKKIFPENKLKGNKALCGPTTFNEWRLASRS